MKFIHTSDWHLGHQLYNYDRSEEFAEMLEQIINIVADEKADALLVSGDVFHSSVPSLSAQRMFADAVMSLRRRCPDTAVIITAGNHDSASRHEIFAEPWRELGVTMIGHIGSGDIDEILDRLIIRLPKGFVAAVPYCNERMMPDGLFEALSQRITELNNDRLPSVLMAHTAVSGCDATGHKEDGRNVGGIDAIDAERLAADFDYVALGHIHRPQVINNTDGRLRYSGTPLAVSFDEEYEHSVTVVSLATHGAEPEVHTVSVTQPRPLVTLPVGAPRPLEEVLSIFKRYPDSLPSYIRLNVLVDSFLPPDATNKARIIADQKQCRFCIINQIRSDSSGVSGQIPLTVEEFRNLEPVEIVSRYAESTGINFSDDMRTLFDEVLQSLNT
ncbi:MAG: exonuclease SbcCD subunit D [Muribaculaceae bacterium]|nr:exonuclease SbcCD subunit D [Muribaculaceae bacterium]